MSSGMDVRVRRLPDRLTRSRKRSATRKLFRFRGQLGVDPGYVCPELALERLP